jgi:hypothetical protein
MTSIHFALLTSSLEIQLVATMSKASINFRRWVFGKVWSFMHCLLSLSFPGASHQFAGQVRVPSTRVFTTDRNSCRNLFFVLLVGSASYPSRRIIFKNFSPQRFCKCRVHGIPGQIEMKALV